jgi:ribonuclease HI
MKIEIPDLLAEKFNKKNKKPLQDFCLELIEKDIKEKEEIFFMYTDGASRGNPGLSGAGVVILNSNQKIIKKGKKFLGSITNNQAEYQALILGLKLALSLDIKNLKVNLDSELVVKQIKGLYKVKKIELQKLLQEVLNLNKKFDQVNFYHIKREFNKEADSLANLAIDNR